MRDALTAQTMGFALAVLIGGCADKPRPWDQGPDAAPPVASPSLFELERKAHGAVVEPSPPPVGAAAAVEVEDAGEAAPPLEMPSRLQGGSWIKCHEGYRVTGDPAADVTRLSLSCGPQNGMSRVTEKTVEGSVEESGTGATFTFYERFGECYRVFAVAEPLVKDLDVIVESHHGSRIASDNSESSWPIVQPDRPFCTLEEGTVTVRVTSKNGSGRFAAEVWKLRTQASPGKVH